MVRRSHGSHPMHAWRELASWWEVNWGPPSDQSRLGSSCVAKWSHSAAASFAVMVSLPEVFARERVSQLVHREVMG